MTRSKVVQYFNAYYPKVEYYGQGRCDKKIKTYLVKTLAGEFLVSVLKNHIDFHVDLPIDYRLVSFADLKTFLDISTMLAAHTNKIRGAKI